MVRVAIDPIRRPWLLLNSPIFMGLSFDVHRSGQSRSDTRQGPPLLSVPAPRSRAAARGRSRPRALTHPLASGTQMRYAGRMDAETMKTVRSEEHTSELQSLMRISYAVFCLKKKKNITNKSHNT